MAAVIVSGGTYGIGREITLLLARRGFSVVAFGLDAAQPGSLARDGIRGTRLALQQAGLKADLLEADVSSASDVDRVVRHAVDEQGGITAVVNNAAIRPIGSVLQTDESTFERVMAVNLKGPFLLSRAAIPHLCAAGGGTIVNLGSGAGRGRPDLAAYAASKGGLYALTMALAKDHLEQQIRVYLVIPSPGTASGMVEAIDAAAGAAPAPTTTSSRATTPSQVARVIASLLSPEAATPAPPLPPSGSVIDVADFLEDASRAASTSR